MATTTPRSDLQVTLQSLFVGAIGAGGAYWL